MNHCYYSVYNNTTLVFSHQKFTIDKLLGFRPLTVGFINGKLPLTSDLGRIFAVNT